MFDGYQKQVENSKAAQKVRQVVDKSLRGKGGDSPITFGDFSPFEKDLLVESEVVIEKQRERVQQLKERLKDVEFQRQRERSKNDLEVKDLKEANAKLRLEIDLLQGELIAQADHDETVGLEKANVEKRAKEADRALTEMKAQLAILKSQMSTLPIENENLKKAKQKLEAEIIELKKQLSPSGALIMQEEAETSNRLQLLRAQVADQERVLSVLRSKTDEAQIAVNGLVDAEFELLESKEIIEDQKKSITRLQSALDSINKERSLIPPTMLIYKQDPRREDKEYVLNEWLDDKTHDLKSILDKLRAMELRGWESKTKQEAETLDESRNGLLLDILQGLRDLAEKQQLGAPRTGVEEGEYVRIPVRHVRLLVPGPEVPDTDGPPLIQYARQELSRAIGKPEGTLVDRQLAIRSGIISIYDASNPSVVVYAIEQWKSKCSWNRSTLMFAIRHEVGPKPDDVHLHLFQAKGPDEFNKIFAAFQYAGFLPNETADKDGPPKTEPDNACTLLHPSGKDGDGRDMPFASNNMLFEFDAKNNRVVIRSGDDKERPPIIVDASRTIFQADPVSQTFKFWVYPSPTDSSKVTLVSFLFPTPTVQYPKYLPEALALKWRGTHVGDGGYAAPVEVAKPKTPPSPPSPKVPPRPPSPRPKAPPSPSSTSSSDIDFDSFIVENRELKLYEAPNTPPVLVLRASEVIGTFDDAARTCTLARVDETGNIDDAFTFEFSDPAKYEMKKKALMDNGFFDRRAEDQGVGSQVAVVERGMLKLHRAYGQLGDRPFVEAPAQFAKAELNSERKEICIFEQLSNGKRRKLMFDVATRKEFENWHRALLFGGFVKEEIGSKAKKAEAFKQMSRYIFPIQMQAEATALQQYFVRVNDGMLLVFKTEEDKQPVFVARKANCEVTTFLKERAMRIKRFKGDPSEDRLEITFRAIAFFDDVHKRLKEQGFAIDQNVGKPSVVHLPRHGMVSFRRRGIAYWKDPKQYAQKGVPTYAIPTALYRSRQENNGKTWKFVPRPTSELNPQFQKSLEMAGGPIFSVTPHDSLENQKWELGVWISGLDSDWMPEDAETQLAKPIFSYSFGPTTPPKQTDFTTGPLKSKTRATFAVGARKQALSILNKYLQYAVTGVGPLPKRAQSQAIKLGSKSSLHASASLGGLSPRGVIVSPRDSGTALISPRSQVIQVKHDASSAPHKPSHKKAAKREDTGQAPRKIYPAPLDLTKVSTPQSSLSSDRIGVQKKVPKGVAPKPAPPKLKPKPSSKVPHN
eukprot:Gregarina_sp_Poly_1__6923@NODE_375_length_9112_cov_54_178331_g309_i0_p1_GENE_NODE_375_length_9112_cov_54_178331_g309_i0NODE_375_length_9112_cov_54_178331_g309_i0_p1_ORF_typecomplete_len1259_score236_88HALZ/PF02183_18/1_4e04HALZ/PF02183_18/1_3e03HALZ/PF02183_18/0_00013HALZ/PF02183_18/9_2e03Cob_adeno_trans/PF01923_18/0_00054Cob_adeno_trans/PF01923_18/1_5e03NRBF2/PF08961_10/1_8e04NRBF2/PF08961_10/0_0088NRBF2/PF08961_10/5_6e02NRBF2/PF08961_10/1_3e04NRBF2/PF08961_10/2_2e02Macoilin/PF09726_9/0_23Methy